MHSKRFAAVLFSLVLAGALQTFLIRPVATQDSAKPRRFTVSGPNASFLLANNYPKTGLRLEKEVAVPGPPMVCFTTARRKEV